MKKIRLNLRPLLDKLLEMENDNMSYAELYIVPGQIDQGSEQPAFLHLDGFSGSGDCTDYESIDETPFLENSKIHKSA